MTGKLGRIAKWSLIPLFSIISLAARTPDLRLVQAVKNQDQQAISVLLKQKVNVNAAEPDGATALAWAAHWDDLGTADLLIRAGADVNAANAYRVTALSLACLNGSAPMVEKLLKAGADPNAAQADGETVLMTCSRTGNAEAVQALLDRGASVNAKESHKGQTALMWALAEKHSDIAKLLIEHKADVVSGSNSGFTPLMFAAQQGDLASAQMLVDAGAGVNDTSRASMTPLLIATASGQPPVAMFLLDKGANTKVSDRRGYTALHYAAQGRSIELVKALLAHGADPNARLKYIPAPGGIDAEGALSMTGATPYVLAALAGNANAMRALAAGGADPNIPLMDNTSALMLAAGVGKYEERGAAQNRNALECVKVALELGADVNATGANGWTALHGAAYTGSDAIIQVLVSKGAKMDVKDRFGQTPLSIAEAIVTKGLNGDADVRPRRYRASTVKLLEQSGANPPEKDGVEIVGSMAVQPIQ